MKLYYVEIKTGMVVAAESSNDAEKYVSRNSCEVSEYYHIEDVIELESVRHLQMIDGEWNADHYPYGDTKERIGDIIPLV